MINVRYINREKRDTGFSIEGIFDAVRAKLKDVVKAEGFYLNISKSRIANWLDVWKESGGKINHITGDVQYLAIGLKGNSTILTVHDVNHYYTLKETNRFHAFLFKVFWLYLPFRFATIITAVSEFTKLEIIKLFPFAEHKIVVIYNPIKPIFRFSERSLTGRKNFRILQIGKGVHKNLKNLIEAVKDNKEQYHIDIVANLDNATNLELKQTGISYIIHANITDEELYERYKECDILFFASVYEGFGMPIIEAQAVGRPVVTSNFGGMKEVAKNSAVLVDPYNVADIKNAIQALKDNDALYAQKVKEGIENASDYNIDIIASKYYTLYKKLATYA